MKPRDKSEQWPWGEICFVTLYGKKQKLQVECIHFSYNSLFFPNTICVHMCVSVL